GNVYRDTHRREQARGAFEAAGSIVGDLASKLAGKPLQDDFLQATAMLIPRLPASTRGTQKQDYGGLTRREWEVAALIARYQTNRAIADRLVLSERTVEKHVENILSKLSLSSRQQIASWAAGHPADDVA